MEKGVLRDSFEDRSRVAVWEQASIEPIVRKKSLASAGTSRGRGRSLIGIFIISIALSSYFFLHDVPLEQELSLPVLDEEPVLEAASQGIGEELPKSVPNREDRSVEGSLAEQAEEIAETSLKTVTYSVSSGDTWMGIFRKLGLRHADAATVGDQLKKLSQKEKIKTVLQVGQELQFRIEGDDFLEILTAPRPGDRISVNRALGGEIEASFDPLPRRMEERVAAGVIEYNFATAALDAGLTYDIIDDTVDLFSDRIAFHRDIRVGDAFALVVREEVLEDGTPLGKAEIVAATLLIDGQRHFAVSYTGPDKKKRYFDGDGELLGESFLRYPLKFSRISSTFSNSRLHPVLKRRMPHHGVDFAAPTGTPVRSVSDGQVTFAGRKGPNGIMVKIRHSSRYRTAYLHLSRIAKGIRRGKKVKRGQVIGAVGSTGRSTGPHLDFRFYDRGRSVNPLTVKLPQVVTLGKAQKIDKAYLEEFKVRLIAFQEQPDFEPI